MCHSIVLVWSPTYMHPFGENKKWPINSRRLASLLLPQSWILHPRMPMDKGHGARQAVVVVNHKSQICSGFKSSTSERSLQNFLGTKHRTWNIVKCREIRKSIRKKKLEKDPFQPIPVTGWWFSNDEHPSSQAEKPWFVFMEQVGSNSTVQKGHKTYLIVGEKAHGIPTLQSFVDLGGIQQHSKWVLNCNPIHWNGFKQNKEKCKSVMWYT